MKKYLILSILFILFLNGCDNYTNDKNGVCYEGKVLKGADIETFEVVDDTYVKDKNSVWYRGQKTNLNSEGFEVINVHHVKNEDGVYFEELPRRFKQLKDVDVDSFFIFSDGSDDYHGRDENNCYSWGELVDMSICDELMRENN